MSQPLYRDPIKDNYLFVEINEFRGTNYIHISLKQYDPDGDFFYRIKGVSVLEPHVDYIIEGLQRISQQLAEQNLPYIRQLSFPFEDNNEQQE